MYEPLPREGGRTSEPVVGETDLGMLAESDLDVSGIVAAGVAVSRVFVFDSAESHGGLVLVSVHA